MTIETPANHAFEKTSGNRSGSSPARRKTTFLKLPDSLLREAAGSTVASSTTRRDAESAERSADGVSSRPRTRAIALARAVALRGERGVRL